MTFKADLYLKTKEEGGRHTPFFNGYTPKLSTNGKLYSCKVILPHGIEMMTPGSKVQVEIETDQVVLNSGMKFELKEGDHITASGSVI